MKMRKTPAMLGLSVILLIFSISSTYALASNATSPARGPFDVLERSARCFPNAHESRANATVPAGALYSNAVKAPVLNATIAKEPDVAPLTASTTPIVQHVVPTSLPYPQEPAKVAVPVQVTLSDAAQAPSDDGDFPSFADWKQRHLANAASAALKDSQSHAVKKSGPGNTDGKKYNVSHDGPGQVDADASSGDHKQQARTDSTAQAEGDDAGSSRMNGSSGDKEPFTDLSLSTTTQRLLHPVPHAGTGDPVLDPLISLRDRTNYASFDCSATLIRSSKSAKSASAILSSKKDRYMLSPCSAKEKFVIVELCDEIQIDTIVLANLEFFSSMFKLFKITAGTAYPESAGTWHELGTFRASNVRGMQVFRPPEPSGGGFYRYIRIDFLSHYGTEYYCPVTILKVFGLNQLDAYRRDQERDARLAEAGAEIIVEAELEGIPALLEVEPETVFLQLVDSKTALVDSGEQETIIESLQELRTSQLSEKASESLSSASSSATSTVTPIPDAATISTSLDQAAQFTSPPLSSATSIGSTELASSGRSTSIVANVSGRQSASSSPQPISSTSISTQVVLSTPLQTSASRPSSVESVLSSLSTDATPKATSAASFKADHTEVAGQAGTLSKRDTAIHGRESPMLSAESATTDVRPGAVLITSSNSLASVANVSESINSALSFTSATIKGHTSTVKAASTPAVTSKVNSSLTSLKSVSTATPVYRTAATNLPPHQAQQKRNDTRLPPHQVVYTQGSNPQPNESIYGTIMKRLLALEVNSTLSTAYVEEQMKSVRYTFKKIEDKLGGFEQSRIKQDQLLRRLMLDLELHRAKLEAERIELSAQLNVLSREMVLEKRLGMAQLLALVVLLFFVILTRGSPSTPFLALPTPSAIPTAFPKSARTARPRSVIDSFPPSSYTSRSNDLRDRRSLGPERKSTTANGSSGMARTSSLKRPIRLSNSMKRPFSPPSAVPYRTTSDDSVLPNMRSPSPHATVAQPPFSAPPEQAIAAQYAQYTPTKLNGHIEGVERSSSVSTLRNPPSSVTQRNSPVDAIKRKLKLMQPRRAASLDDTADEPQRPQTASVLDRRKMFTFGPAPERESNAVSVDEEERKAWQSTSEDSAEEGSQIRKWPPVFPPSPDPSDAEPTTT